MEVRRVGGPRFGTSKSSKAKGGKQEDGWSLWEPAQGRSDGVWLSLCIAQRNLSVWKCHSSGTNLFFFLHLHATDLKGQTLFNPQWWLDRNEPPRPASGLHVAVNSSVVVCLGGPALRPRADRRRFLNLNVVFIVGTAGGSQLGWKRPSLARSIRPSPGSNPQRPKWSV